MAIAENDDRILREPSPTHLHAGGAADWDISPEVLAFLQTHVKAGMHTLETGAGRSTIEFARAGAFHIAVTPMRDEAQRIEAACRAERIDTSALRFEIGFSQDVLPQLAIAPLDVALIDGGHGFPVPAVDFQFIAPKLKVGGLLLIDDVDLWTGAMIVDFLKGEKDWRLERILRGRTAIVRLLNAYAPHEWVRQPTVVSKSRWRQRARKAANLCGLLARFDFSAIREKLAKEQVLAEAAKRDY
jgi:predicted O-methyltransferase YrrM